MGNEEGECSGKQVLLKDLPAASITSFFLPSLSEPREVLLIILIVFQTKQTNLAQAGETRGLSYWKTVTGAPPVAVLKWLPGVGW